MIKTEEKMIGGVNYAVTQFPARIGLSIKTSLIKLVAPSAFSLIGGEGGLDKDLNSLNLSKAIESLVLRLDEDYVYNLIMKILSSTKREGKDITESIFNMEYAGNYEELYKAILFVLEVNYGSFFQSLGIGKNLKDMLP